MVAEEDPFCHFPEVDWADLADLDSDPHFLHFDPDSHPDPFVGPFVGLYFDPVSPPGLGLCPYSDRPDFVAVPTFFEPRPNCNAFPRLSDLDGENFYNIAEIVDTFTGERAYTSEFYSVTVDNQKTLWVGTADGLAKSTDNGYTWSLFRAFKPTGQEGTPRTYAYPNPFSPLRHNQYDQD